MKIATLAVHAGAEPDPRTGAISCPVYQTSTYVQEAPAKHKGYEYARTQNPTREALERAVAALEGGRAGVAFASGLAAIDAIVRLLSAGDRIVAGNDLYGGTFRLFEQVYRRFGLLIDYVDPERPEALGRALEGGAKMVWLESPTNPLLKIADIAEACRLAKRAGALVAVDNTFASPYLQRPLELGADIVCHSTTKYLGGHADVVGGAVIVNDPDLEKRLRFLQNAVGAVPGPWDAFLVLRGLKTLPLRMERHCKNAEAVARMLADHPRVAHVNYPGLSNHRGHEVARRQMPRGFGGMVSFELKADMEEAKRVTSRTKLFQLAESLGGVESLIEHPASMTHASVAPEKRRASGLSDGLIRLSVGIEDADDLAADLRQAIGG